jgi:hypothetical protein
MRRISILCATTLIAGLATCQGDAPPTALSPAGNDVGVLADEVIGVPACGFENGEACPVFAAGPRCDLGLEPIGGTCVNDTRHLVGADSRGTWLDWALANQRTLARDEPINWVMHLTTHNAFNNLAEGHDADPNQVWSISDQLDLGSRYLWLDLHVLFGRVLLCHSPGEVVGCLPGDREAGYAFKEIAAWLAANPEEIIVIDLEAYVEGHTAEVRNALNTFFGTKLYRQADRAGTAYWPSRRELRAMGKQVIVGARGVDLDGTSHSEGYLLGRLDIRYIKHFEVTRTNGIVTGCLGGDDPHETALQTDAFFRTIGEDRTTFSLLLPTGNKFHVGVVDAAAVADLAACGVRLISLDMMGGHISTPHPYVRDAIAQLPPVPNRIPRGDRRPSAVWSWREGDRGTSGNAALLDGSTGRWRSAAPTGVHRFACARVRSETTVPPGRRAVNTWTDSIGKYWRVTARSGAWNQGGRACLEEFGADGFVFSVPVHGLMNGRLRLANASRPDIWLNYNDIEHEGDWVINRRPVALAGDDRTVECNGHHTTSVQLDARASTDENGHAMTFEWRGPFGTATGAQPTVNLPLGRHEITLLADDGFGGVSTDIVVITVVDTRPPEIRSATPSPATLWPTNHKMNPVAVTVDVTDLCDASPTCRIISVTSNEPVNATGDGNTEPDWRITGALTVELRAERAGPATSRVYTLIVQCTDASGNAATRAVQVTVPHDQAKS